MFENIARDLLNFQKPARYIGSELGIPQKDYENSFVRFALCFPDLYEIGMSNLGIKIIYDIINSLEFSSCERVFSVWRDFEKYLRDNNYPLYALESKSPLNSFDFVGFSIQYELLFTNFLNILDLGKIEVLAKDRKEGSPIIICGGPSVTNPLPYSPFADLFLIGEGEEAIVEILSEYKSLKEKKISREDIIDKLSKIEGVYSPKYTKNIVRRRVYQSFVRDKGINNHIIPNIDIVQNKLVVEIMRGCPNKCRFCQAGVIYKPYREKSIDTIVKSIDEGLSKLGIDEVTLASLSSGDYSKIIELAQIFNEKYKNKFISFSFPSLRVESFNKELLPLLSRVRKSGLTFAIESGGAEGRFSINKPIELEKILDIINYAISNGWKMIKLYFMIGLPNVSNEANDIINFVDNILQKFRKLEINLNVAVFAPKPHTPFQYVRQISIEEAEKIFEKLERHYKKTGVKIKRHNPDMSFVEGVIGRGDENVGYAFLDIFRKGVRFDSWEEEFDFNNYTESFEKFDITYERYLEERGDDKIFWKFIDCGVDDKYLKNELNKSVNRQITKSCKEECEKECSICGNGVKTEEAQENGEISLKNENAEPSDKNLKIRYLIEFSKKNLMKYLGHIDLLKYFERLFRRAEIDLIFTRGFNPHPKMQFSSALSLGIESNCEILEFFTHTAYETEQLMSRLKRLEHPNLSILRIKKIENLKKISFVEQIFMTKYILSYDALYYEEIKKRVAEYSTQNLTYIFEKNGNTIQGVYSDYLSLYLNKEVLYAEELNIH
nr:TIGR03960 family B12-binding radical SAM protein [Spirochaetota bacterium]